MEDDAGNDFFVDWSVEEEGEGEEEDDDDDDDKPAVGVATPTPRIDEEEEVDNEFDTAFLLFSRIDLLSSLCDDIGSDRLFTAVVSADDDDDDDDDDDETIASASFSGMVDDVLT